MKRMNILMLVICVASLLDGCDKKSVQQAMPEVNEENCQLETIMQITDRTTREQFGGLCSRRPIGISPTENPKNWLELTNSKTKG